jgi:transposase-like protein DUF772
MTNLPITGTGALLEKLSPFVPDDLINSLCAERPGPGRPALFSPAQLFRVLLLILLTPAHSFNLLVELLPENRSWRSFARLRNRSAVPDVRMLHQFRQRLDLIKLRQINKHLLQPLLEGTNGFSKTVAIIDATDLPAATSAYKKMLQVSTALIERIPEHVVAKTDRAVISLDIKSTPCAFGCVSTAPASYWHH